MTEFFMVPELTVLLSKTLHLGIQCQAKAPGRA